MSLTRRKILRLGAASATFGLAPSAWMQAFAENADAKHTIMSANGEIGIVPINHASLGILAAGKTIIVDPVGDPALYANLPKPNLVFVTHEHGDHFNMDTLSALVGEQTELVTNPAVFEKLPAAMQAKTHNMANGDVLPVAQLKIDAIPAYNMAPERKKFHPEGRDNGYIISVDGKRLYLAGDTEDVPEMRALKDIDLAFVPMILPYTMDVEHAAEGTIAFAPKVVYPYHYGDSDTPKFKKRVEAANPAIEVRLHNWYGA